MKYLILFFAVFGICLAAPQYLILGDFVNGIVESVIGKPEQYNSPPYTVAAIHGVGSTSFEERNYEGGKNWACSKQIVNEENYSNNGMFMMLFRYISGENDANTKINMTIPVSSKWTKLQNNSFEKEMCFYLDEEHQNNPPQPTNPKVYIVIRPAMTVYTRKVSGYMNDGDWIEESSNLDTMLSNKFFWLSEGQVDTEQFYTNVYNSPMQFWNRRNELWKIKL